MGCLETPGEGGVRDHIARFASAFHLLGGEKSGFGVCWIGRVGVGVCFRQGDLPTAARGGKFWTIRLLYTN